MEVSPPVLEKKIFEGFLPYMDMAAILVMWPASCHQIFIFFYLKAYIEKFGLERHSSFWENPVLIFVCTRPCAKVKKWPWPLILTYLHKFNYMSAPTNFQVTGCNSFWKIHCFHFFPIENPRYQIWPRRKISQGQPRVIIWTKYDWLEFPMLHTKFRGNRSAGSGEENFWRVFDPNAANKLSFSLPKEAPHKIWLWLTKRFRRRRCLIMWTDGRRTDRRRTPDHGYTISSHMSLWLRWAKSITFFSSENYHFYTPEISQYIARKCFRNVLNRSQKIWIFLQTYKSLNNNFCMEM